MPPADFRDLPTWVLARAAMRSQRVLAGHLGRHGATWALFHERSDGFVRIGASVP